MRRRLPTESDTIVARQPGTQEWNRIAGLNTQLVWAPEHGLQAGGLQAWTTPVSCGRREKLATFSHFGLHESFEYRRGLSALSGDPLTSLDDRYAGSRRNFAPHITRATCPMPDILAILPRHGNQTEISDRSSLRASVAFDHHDLQSPGG